MIEQGRFTIIQGASYRRSKEEVTIELKKKKTLQVEGKVGKFTGITSYFERTGNKFQAS